jgi:GNAT superfamily N-acetyltransferase
MTVRSFDIRQARPTDRPAIEALNLDSFAPANESFAEIIGPRIDAVVHPDRDAKQRGDLTNSLAKPGASLWVATVADEIVGFMVVAVDYVTRVGEVAIIAVAAAHRGVGIGSGLVQHAMNTMRAEGMLVAEIGTGGDQFHAPARRCYERNGFTPVPVVHYFRALDV